MIFLYEQKIKFVGEAETIEKWEVWFQTPFGVTPDLKTAVERCQQSDLDPEIFVTPVPVAVGPSQRYEIFFPRR